MDFQKNKLLIAIIVIVVLIIIISFIGYKYYNLQKTQSNKVDKFISGMWQANDEFCQKADIDKMLLYIGDGLEEKNAYLLIYSEGNVVVSKKLQIKMYPVKVSSSEWESEYKVEIIDADDPDDTSLNDIMPSKVNMKLSIINGRLCLYKKKKIYADLFKDNISTNLANIL